MNKLKIFLIFSSIVAATNAQICLSPKPMADFKLSEFGTGTWYTIAGKASMATPLTEKCSRSQATNNGTFLFFEGKSISTNISMVWKPAANGVFKWSIPKFQLGPMTVTDILFDVSLSKF